MSFDDVWATALRHGNAGRHGEALRYYRRAARLADGAWEAHQNLASALQNSAGESRLHLGVLEPAMRSSVERQAALRESFQELERSEELAPDLASRAYTIRDRAQTLFSWGLSLDALQEAARAAALTDAGEDSMVLRYRADMSLGR
jgi:tetratricopeptide (TPR) repeat protein